MKVESFKVHLNSLKKSTLDKPALKLTCFWSFKRVFLK